MGADGRVRDAALLVRGVRPARAPQQPAPVAEELGAADDAAVLPGGGVQDGGAAAAAAEPPLAAQPEAQPHCVAGPRGGQPDEPVAAVDAGGGAERRGDALPGHGRRVARASLPGERIGVPTAPTRSVAW